MWRRNSLTLSSRLANPNSNPSLPLLQSIPKSHHHGLLARSTFTSTESISAADPVNRVPYIGPRATSASVFGMPSLAGLAKHYSRCYWELSKARLSMLVVATSGTGYILGSGSSVDYLGLCCTCAGTMMVAASASSLNQMLLLHNLSKNGSS
ncbi:protoheme ix farnesyltransferase mitochondrial [Phtheirospermum japonicum]|uniref:Protoheme ix farnesyltransferase mitochondrial n=1 Tax=Phtheirospermum japonicum TaxID=374723 RepID=A0A830DLT3_9LAMI|nr:protoheme ix farnesyltransferase mitochondrial [Phtheirospermum japonicum]